MINNSTHDSKKQQEAFGSVKHSASQMSIEFVRQFAYAYTFLGTPLIGSAVIN